MTRTLLIDNYDSFTYNIFHLLAAVDGREPLILRNDDLDGWLGLTEDEVARIVISPGPGRPDRDRDFGISGLALDWTDTPLLGICLGFQGLCLAEGARIARGAEPVHGRISRIRHDGRDLFAGLPSPFEATRYHSLVARDVPADLEITATTEDDVVMAVRHRRRPHWGVQFHPESITTEYGHELLANFRELADRHTGTGPAPAPAVAPPSAPPAAETRFRVQVESVEEPVDAESAFAALFAAERASFWLDSSVRTGLSRFSILAAPSGPLGELVSYDVADGHVRVLASDGTERERHAETLFAYLERELDRRRVEPSGTPSGFELGYVGYLGYELKADCGSRMVHRSDQPDGFLAFCDRAAVLDHETGQAWLLALSDETRPETTKVAEAWLAQARKTLATVVPEPFPLPDMSEVAPIAALHRHSPTEYRDLIERCREQISAGESYELCLTTQLSAMVQAEPWDLYRVLRRVNPAPFAAYLGFPGFRVLSSSPERFLRIEDGAVESRPIKGTRPRTGDAESDAALVRNLALAEKDRAENLMIVDLLRNDLGVVSEIGSVHVPELFAVETHASVHQLVSTVRSRLRPEVSPVACVRAAFPGGSMTGAPKKRTMEILEDLEGGERGVYSGALGYFSLTGTVDLSIVIRTIVLAGGEARLGVGGAIVAQSDPDDEIEETRVKAAALLRALSIAEHRATSPSRTC